MPFTEWSACVVVCDDTGLILQVSKRDDPTDFGLPGGKPEPGETLQETARRECIEETGYEPLGLAHLFSAPARTRNCMVFVAKDFRKVGEPLPGEGVTRWAQPEKLAEGTYGYFHQVTLRKLVALGTARATIHRVQVAPHIYEDCTGCPQCLAPNLE